MTKARDLADIISGGFTASDIPNLDTSKITTGELANARVADLPTSKITSGTFADARFPATLPVASGVNLTALNATNIGSGNVTTARLGSGTANGTTFLRGDQTYAEAGGGAWTLISSQTASDVASIEFDGSLTDTYTTYKVFGDLCVPATDGQTMNAVFKRDGQGSYNTGASDYEWVAQRYRMGSAWYFSSDGSDAFAKFRMDTGNSSNTGSNFELVIRPRTGKYCTYYCMEIGQDTAGDIGCYTTTGSLKTASDVQSIKFQYASGNIATGNFRLYGLNIS